MQRSPSHYLAFALILTLAGSVFSIVMPATQPSYALHENVTVNVDIDDVTKTYEPGDSVSIVGTIDDVVDNEDATISFIEPSGSIEDDTTETPDEDDGTFDYLYDIPDSADEGVWTIEVEYDGDKDHTYFIVDDVDDTIRVVLDNNDGIYEAGDKVTISGQVDEQDDSEENVLVTVLDPTNDEIVDEDEALLGDGTLGDDEFEYEFTLDDDVSHGRYAVKVTYDIDDQEGSTLFEILDEDSGSDNDDFTGDSDSDGDLSAQIEQDSYEPGANVAIQGSIDGYDSDDNEDLEIVVLDPDDEEVDDYGDSNADVENDGDFDYDFDLDDNADEGTYTVQISYASDEIEMTFEVQEGAGNGGADSDEDITIKLNKSSYLAGETITVTGTVAEVADEEDEEQVSIFVYQPGGQVILKPGSSKYVTPSDDGKYSATIILPSDLDVDEDYTAKASYLGKTAVVSFDITGVSSSPTDRITVNTDKDEYTIGSTVEISGRVPTTLITEDQQLLIRVNKPDGNPCRIDPLDVPSSGSYTYSMVLGGTCSDSGEYEIEVTYNGQKGETSFALAGLTGGNSYSLSAGGKTYTIEYDISDGSIKSMFARPDEKKLVVNINAEGDGQLTLVLPREVIDAIENGRDIDYIVSIEDESGNIDTIEADEIENTDEARTLLIEYEAGAERVEITGTQVVPEFGAIAAIVMAVAIVGIIVATARYNNKFTLFRQ